MAETQKARNTFEYKQCLWGDSIYGTKEELQAIGIGEGLIFPGEPGGPKRLINARDPRGFATKLERFDNDIYNAQISFPGRERTSQQWIPVAPGVRKRGWCSFDEYSGTAEALAAAGLVRTDQLPGQPGMRKTLVSIFPDGTMPSGAPTVRHKEVYAPGGKHIARVSKITYVVSVYLAEDEKSKREEEQRREDSEWEARMRALPRPAPLAVVNHPSLDDLLSLLTSR
jgi:hypothetical protein